MQLISTKVERGLRKISKYRFLNEDCYLTREELIHKYNQLIEDIWGFQETIDDLHRDYDDMAEAYEEAASELYG